MTKQIYKGRVVTLNIETVALPNGVTVDLETIRHPGASAVVPLKDDGTVDRKSTRLNSSHMSESRMPSSA